MGDSNTAKLCSKCNVVKDVSEFSLRWRAGFMSGFASYCKPCKAEWQRIRRANPSPARPRYIDFDNKTKRCPKCKKVKPFEEFPRNATESSGLQTYCGPCAVEKSWATGLKRKYGITQEQYENMLAAQAGACAICRESDGLKRLAVDHDHVTGMIRGLLCSDCNLALGKFKESPKLLGRARVYLYYGGTRDGR